MSFGGLEGVEEVGKYGDWYWAVLIWVVVGERLWIVCVRFGCKFHAPEPKVGKARDG